MFRIFLIASFVCFSFMVSAQGADSLFVKQGGNGWFIMHNVKAGETVFSLARRYHVPPAILADVNDINYQQELNPAMKLNIPIGAYNLLNGKPVNENDARAFYYRAGADESLYKIARNSNVQQKTIQQWNKLDNTEVAPGRALLAGWVLYDATPVNAPVINATPPPVHNNVPVNNAKPPVQAAAAPKLAPVQQKPAAAAAPPSGVKPPAAATLNPNTLKPAVKDTLYIVDGDTISTGHVKPEVPLSEMETLFMSQTNNGTQIVEEKGPAVFYNTVTRGNVYSAFHNTAPRGTVIKVYNPGSGKTIFVKVLGPLPGTVLYHNALIGIPARAKAELGVKENKAWCEISYAGF